MYNFATELLCVDKLIRREFLKFPWRKINRIPESNIFQYKRKKRGNQLNQNGLTVNEWKKINSMEILCNFCVHCIILHKINIFHFAFTIAQNFAIFGKSMKT